jgi:predicted ATPase
LLEAYHARLPSLLWMPDFQALRESSEEVVRLYDRERHREHAYYFGGHDSRVCARGFQAISLWGLGFPVQSQQAAFACAADARDLGHTFSIAHSLNWGGLPHLLLKDVEACRAVTDELYPIAERNRFPWPLTYARFQRGWLLAQESDRAAGIEQMLASVGAPSIPMQSLVLTMIAEQQLLAGRLGDAAATLDKAVEYMNTQHINVFRAEATRLRGEVMLAQSRRNAAEAEQVLRQAVAIGVQQSCRPLQLRAATSLASLLAGEGRKAEAQNALAPIYGEFTEGFSKPDLLAAKILLDQLA